MKNAESTEVGPGPLQLPEDILLLSRTAIVCGSQCHRKYFLSDWLRFTLFFHIGLCTKVRKGKVGLESTNYSSPFISFYICYLHYIPLGTSISISITPRSLAVKKPFYCGFYEPRVPWSNNLTKELMANLCKDGLQSWPPTTPPILVRTCCSSHQQGVYLLSPWL